MSIQYPGRQDRRFDACLNSVEELADGAFEELSSYLDGGPIALFGHSMGAIVAYEVARRMEGLAGVAPVRLFASGRRAPSRWRQENVHRLVDNGIVAELQRLNGTNSALLGDQDLLRMILPAVRSDYRAIENYVHPDGLTLSCPITVLVGDSDPLTTSDEAEAWRVHTSGRCDVRVFPGGHFYLNDHANTVIELITAELGAAKS